MSARPRVNVVVLVLGLAVTAGLVAVMASGFGNNPREVPSVLVGQPAPDFALVDLDGRRWSLEELRGRPVVLNFWSTWCLPCKQEHPVLQEAARRYPEVQFLGVIYSDDPVKARRYLAMEGTTYHHLVDERGTMAIDYGVAGVPETFFIDRSGQIVHKQVGPVSPPVVSRFLGRIQEGS